MGKKKIAKKTNPKNQKIPTPKCAKTQQKLDRKKRVRARNIVQKGEPKEPPRKTGARDCLISPPIDERILKPPVYPDSVGCETDQSSRESEESVNKPRYSIADCVSKLAEIPGITVGDPFFMFVLDHFRIDPIQRIHLMSMENDKCCLSYLNYVREKYASKKNT